MSEETNDKDLRDFFQHRFEDESQDPPREVWGFVKDSLPLKTNWWKLGFYYFTGAVIVLVSSFFIYKYATNKGKLKNTPKTTIEQLEDKQKRMVDSVENQHKTIKIDSLSEGDKTSSQELRSSKEEINLNTSKVFEGDPERVGTPKGWVKTKKPQEQQFQQKTKTNYTSKRNTSNETSFVEEDSERVVTLKGLESEKNLNSQKENSKQETIDNSKTDKGTNTNNSTDSKKTDEVDKLNQETNPDNKEDTIPALENTKIDSVNVVKNDTVTNSKSADSIIKSQKTKSKWTMELYFGMGRNTRNIIGTFDGDNLVNLDFSDRRFKMRNKVFGFGLSYARTNYFSIQTGLNIGSNRAKSRTFQKRFIKNTETEYQFNTSEGEARLANTELNQYYQSSDTVELRVQFNHQSSYYSIPISCKLSYPKTIISPYLRLGSSFDFELGRRTTIDITKDGQTTNHPLIKSKGSLGKSIQGLLGFGFSTNTKFGLNIFIEQQFSIAITPYIIRPNYRVRNNYSQFRFGLSYNF